jgi:hypothetical protein
MADKVDSTTNPGSEPSGLDRRDFLRVRAASVAIVHAGRDRGRERGPTPAGIAAGPEKGPVRE